jgi:hypothetical protein
LTCTRGLASITWGLEKHSSCMLVKEQLAIQAREDLVLAHGQVKLTRFGLCDYYSSLSGMLGLRF